jgi:hypothetical protein
MYRSTFSWPRQQLETKTISMFNVTYNKFKFPLKNNIDKCMIFNSGFEVLTVVITKSTIFWDVIPCSLIEVHRRLEGLYCFLLQGRKRVKQATRKKEPESISSTLKIETVCSSDTSGTSIGPHAVISETVPFIHNIVSVSMMSICCNQEHSQSAKVQRIHMNNLCS